MHIRNMIVLALAVLVLGGPMAAAADASESSGTPAAVFKKTAYYFPTVVDGVAITHAFPVRNTGTADLKITKVKTG